MSQKSATLNPKPPAERVVRDISRATRRHYSAEDKSRIAGGPLPGRQQRYPTPPQGRRPSVAAASTSDFICLAEHLVNLFGS
jgi:hypothetical protein